MGANEQIGYFRRLAYVTVGGEVARLTSDAIGVIGLHCLSFNTFVAIFFSTLNPKNLIMGHPPCMESASLVGKNNPRCTRFLVSGFSLLPFSAAVYGFFSSCPCQVERRCPRLFTHLTKKKI